MEQAIGIVTEVSDGMAKVKIDRKGMCGDSCATCKSICSMHETVLQARNTANAKVNDKVCVTIPTRKGISAMIITYGVPLLYALIITVLMAVGMAEKTGAIALISGIILWFLALWVLEKKGIFFTAFKTEITEILNKEEDTNESE